MLDSLVNAGEHRLLLLDRLAYNVFIFLRFVQSHALHLTFDLFPSLPSAVRLGWDDLVGNLCDFVMEFVYENGVVENGLVYVR